MIRINNENVISSLFKIGFDRVDSNLLSFVLGKIMLEMNDIKYSNGGFSGFFKSAVVKDEFGYRLKDGYSIDTNISLNEIAYISLGDMLNTKPELIDYLSKLDYRELILKKLNLLGTKHEDLYKYFCKKEKEIIADMFGIDDSVNIFKKAYELEFGDEIPDIPFIRMGESQKKHEIAKECLKESEKEIQNTAFDWYEPSFFEDDDQVIKKRTK